MPSFSSLGALNIGGHSWLFEIAKVFLGELSENLELHLGHLRVV